MKKMQLVCSVFFFLSTVSHAQGSLESLRSGFEYYCIESIKFGSYLTAQVFEQTPIKQLTTLVGYGLSTTNDILNDSLNIQKNREIEECRENFKKKIQSLEQDSDASKKNFKKYIGIIAQSYHVPEKLITETLAQENFLDYYEKKSLELGKQITAQEEIIQNITHELALLQPNDYARYCAYALHGGLVSLCVYYAYKQSPWIIEKLWGKKRVSIEKIIAKIETLQKKCSTDAYQITLQEKQLAAMESDTTSPHSTNIAALKKSIQQLKLSLKKTETKLNNLTAQSKNPLRYNEQKTLIKIAKTASTALWVVLAGYCGHVLYTIAESHMPIDTKSTIKNAEIIDKKNKMSTIQNKLTTIKKEYELNAKHAMLVEKIKSDEEKTGFLHIIKNSQDHEKQIAENKQELEKQITKTEANIKKSTILPTIFKS